MALKIYVSGNYLYIEDVAGKVLNEGNKGVFEFLKDYSDSTEYSVFKNQKKIFPKKISINDIQKQNGDPYTLQEFDTFKEQNTAFSSAPGRGAHGFFDYNDLATQTTPLSVVGGTGFTNLTNDEAGPFTNKNYPPNGVTDVWDEVSQSFDFSELPLGSKIHFRVDLDVTTAGANAEVDLALELGGSAYTLGIARQTFKNAGTYNMAVGTYIYIGDLNTKNNAANFKIESTNNIDVVVNGWACHITLY